MIFLEYVGSRACLSAEIKISPVKSTFYGTFFYLSGGQPKFKCRVNVKMGQRKNLRASLFRGQRKNLRDLLFRHKF